MSVVEIAYNPNDFYYVSSGVYKDISSSCSIYLGDKTNWEGKCCTNINGNCTSKWNEVSGNCFEFEVCKNKEYADSINKLENNSNGENERHRNFRNQYHNEIIKTINISASILLITYLSVYFFKS
jgi:hypothetical protein